MITGLSDGKIILNVEPKHYCRTPGDRAFGHGSVWRCLHCHTHWQYLEDGWSLGWFRMSNRRLKKFFKQHPELKES